MVPNPRPCKLNLTIGLLKNQGNTEDSIAEARKLFFRNSTPYSSFF